MEAVVAGLAVCKKDEDDGGEYEDEGEDKKDDDEEEEREDGESVEEKDDDDDEVGDKDAEVAVFSAPNAHVILYICALLVQDSAPSLWYLQQSKRLNIRLNTV